MTRSIRWFGLVALLVFGLAAGPARAQVEAFRVTGGGTGPDGVSLAGADSPHNATGTATHVGKYSGDGVFNSLSFDPATGGGTFHGTFTFVAKNGDKLACTYGDTNNGADQAGTYQAFPTADGKVYVVFLAEFNPIPSECTGRFKNVVDGSFLMLAVSEPVELTIDANGFTPPFHYDWDGTGWLKYKRGK
jgi:hypothetical protein